jgi:diguanylate cyclase (GGDEF)-like protein
MNSLAPTHRSLSRQFTVLVVSIAVVAIAIIAAFTAWSVSRVDSETLTRQTGFVSFALTEQLKTLPVQQTSATTWDEAVREVKAANAAWISDNLTIWMGTYFGHNRDYVLNEHDRPVQLMKDGKLVGNEAFDHDKPTIGPLLARLRAAMQTASAGLQNSTDAISSLGAKDVVLLDGQPAMVSVVPIIPDTSAVIQAPGTEYLHVAIRYIDQKMVDGMAEEFALAGAHMSKQAESGFWTASVPVVNGVGKVLGHVVWSRYRPGLALIQEAAPALAVGLFMAFALVAYMLRRLRRTSIQLQASEAQTQFLAFHDTLTGLPNRALFEDRLDRSLALGRREGQRLALLCLDLDRFKNINDTLGHPAGDELVRQVARRLSGCVREIDTVARLGGDEFAIIQVDVRDEREAEALAQRIAAEFVKPFDLLGDPAFVSASIGIAMSQGDGSGRDDMLRKSDIALYEAKSQGRARYQLFAGDMDDVLRRRRAIERDLRVALESGTEIKAVYQPLFANNGKKLVGAEALARWDHPVHGTLSPEVFIGIAEERGLIEQLGEFILRQACTFAVETGLPWVAVNVSPVQFRNERIVDRVMAILLQTGLPPQRLQLEITESVLLENSGMADRLIASFREQGIRIALDDFGTGYSSMSYLRRYGVDKLKIDRSFVQELGISDDANAIVRAMVNLGRALHMQVTAEGVETVEQRDHLSAIGCHELQGFLLSRPIASDRLAALLNDAESGDKVQQSRA